MKAKISSIKIMKAKISSIIFASHVLSKSMVILSIVLIIISSCGRNRETRIVNIAPPTLPPAPPNPPSMVGSDTIWNFEGQQPVLPGGKEALFKYIARNMQYPDSAKANGIQGKVIVKFCVSKRGNVSNYEITKSVNPDLDAEALRVVKTVTKFEPGYQDGKPVAVWYEVPISFVLK